MSLKTCKDCKVEQPIGNFYKNKTYRDGLFATCKSCLSVRQREYRKTEKGREVEARAFKTWYAKNREYDLARRPKWREKNREEYNAYMRDWRSRNQVGDRDSRVVREDLPRNYKSIVKDFYGNICLFPDCDRDNIEVDHVVPLVLGGEHSLSNMQTLCRHHNGSKGGRSTHDYRNGRIIGKEVLT